MDRFGEVIRAVAPVVPLGAVVVGGTLGQDAGDGRTDVGALGWTLVAVAVLVCVVRRRVPLVTLAVAAAATGTYLALGLPYGPVFLPVVVGAWAVARWASLRPALVVASLAVVALWVHLLWNDPVGPGGQQRLDGLLALLPSAAFVVVPFAAGYALRVRAEAGARAQEHVLAQQVAAERLRLSQDVHDVVGHGLAAIKMQADVALHVGADGTARDVRPSLEAISATAASALHELRDVLGRLRVEGQDPGDERTPTRGLADLPALVGRVEQAGVRIALSTEGDARPLPAATDLVLYRVLQEALTNVLRHGDGTAARLTVRWSADAVGVEVANRPGPPTVTVGGSGLAGMRERVEAAGGTLEHERRGPDFVVRAQVPTTTATGEQAP